MIAGIVLGSLALFFAVALYQRVWIDVSFGSARRSIEVRYSFFRFRVPKPKRRRKGEEEKEKKRKGSGGALGWLKLAPEILRASGKGLKFLFRHSEIRSFRIEGRLGTGDVATTGIMFGAIQAFRGVLGRLASRLELDITPDFEEGKTGLALEVEGAVRLGTLLAVPFIVLWYLPKRELWRLLHEGRRRKASGRRGFLLGREGKEVGIA